MFWASQVSPLTAQQSFETELNLKKGKKGDSGEILWICMGEGSQVGIRLFSQLTSDRARGNSLK